MTNHIISRRGALRSASAGLALAASLLSQGAFAQDAKPADEGASANSDVIIVEARRREEKLQDVPVVVNAVRGETIEKLNIRDAKDLVSLVPGLDMRDLGYASSIQLRGLQYNVNSGSLPSIATYFNDAPIVSRAIMSQLYDIGQVEVLRGPQGTLRGQASPSGSITFTSKKPNLTEVGAYVSGTATTSHGGNINGAINIPVIEDVLGVRLAGVWDRNRFNRVHSISKFATLAEPFQEERGGRISVLFKPTDWLKLQGTIQTLAYESKLYDHYASYNLVDPAGAASPVTIRPEDRLSIQDTNIARGQNFKIYNWQAELRYAGQKLIYVGSKVNFDNLIKSNQDAANFVVGGKDYYQTTDTHNVSWSHEVRLQNEERVAGIFDYVLGYFHTKATTTIHLDIETPITLPSFACGGVAGCLAAINVTPIDSAGPGGGPSQPSYETSFFGNIAANIGDKFQISGGLRHVKYTESAGFLKIGTSLLPTSPGVNDQKWIYTASAQYKFTPDAMVYFSTGTSRRRGPTIFSTNFIRSALMNSFLNMPSEDSKSYELGFKTSWLDKRLIFNVTAFRQTFKNYVYQSAQGVYIQGFDFVNNAIVPSVKNDSQFAAAVPVRINGVEAELDWKLSPRFNFGLVASYADGKITNGTVPCNDLNGDHVDDKLTAAPTLAQVQAAYGANYMGTCNVSQRSSNQSPFSATLQAEYTAPIGNKVEMFARGLLSYYGASKNDPTLAFDDIGAYGLLNLFAGVRDPDGGWEVNFFGKNVLNTVKYTRFGAPASSSYQELTFGNPPTVGKAFSSTYSTLDASPPREFGVTMRIALGSR